MKTKILLIIWLFTGMLGLDAQEVRFAKKEARYVCHCYQQIERMVRKLKRKTKRQEKKYKPGLKLFGGNSIDFRLGDCLDKQRSRKMRKYLASLNDREDKRFRRKVKALVKKRNPKCVSIL
ncbi:MAG: hypothetical protein AAFV25_18580 [Bacteroidota bacterium]